MFQNQDDPCWLENVTVIKELYEGTVSSLALAEVLYSE